MAVKEELNKVELLNFVNAEANVLRVSVILASKREINRSNCGIIRK